MTRGGRIAREHFKLRDNGYFVVNCGVCEWSTTSELLLARHLDSADHRSAEERALEAVARQTHAAALEAIVRGLAQSSADRPLAEFVFRAREVISKIDGFVLEGMS